MTLTFTTGTSPCASCRGSADGCEARQLFARGERCCRRCSHGDSDNEQPPNNANNALIGHFFCTDNPRTTPGLGDHPAPGKQPTERQPPDDYSHSRHGREGRS